MKGVGRKTWVSLLAFSFGSMLSAQEFTVNLPADAFFIKLSKGMSNMALPIPESQGPALNGITYVESDVKTSTMQMRLYHRPQEVAVAQLKENGYMFVRYLVPLKNLGQFFEYDTSKVLHTAPDVKADLYRKVNNGVVVPGTETQGLAGLSAGRYMSWSHARSLRGVKFGFFDLLKVLSGNYTVSPSDYEKEMATFWQRPADDEWCIVDLVVDVLPTNDKVIVEAIRARVWALVDDSYLPYTKSTMAIRVAGLKFVSDPKDGLPNVGAYLENRTKAFKSKGVVERIFMDGLKSAMGPYVSMPSPAPASVTSSAK